MNQLKGFIQKDLFGDAFDENFKSPPRRIIFSPKQHVQVQRPDGAEVIGTIVCQSHRQGYYLVRPHHDARNLIDARWDEMTLLNPK